MNLDNIIIPITDKSIETVPCTQIFDDSELNEAIQRHCKEVLTLAKNRRDGHPNNEVGRLIDITTGDKVLDMPGYWDDKYKTCRIRTDTDAYGIVMENARDNALIFIHNHPNNSHISFNDISQFLYNSQVRAIIAIGNTEGTHFLVKNDEKYDYCALNVRIHRYVWNAPENEHGKRMTDVEEKMINTPEKYGLIYGYSARRRK